MDEDEFDSLLNLEDNFYDEGYKQGVEDGSRAGRIEGRQFGLEKGFEKYLAMGRLHGKACVWGARMPATLHTQSQNPSASKSQTSDPAQPFEEEKEEGTDTTAKPKAGLIPLPANERLEKHIRTLWALTEHESLSTENNEDSVSDFDDRFKRAQSKAKVIQNIIGERDVDSTRETAPEDDAGASSAKSRGIKIARATTTEKNMEDFGVKPSSSGGQI